MDNFSYEIKRDLIKLVYERRDLWDPTSPNVKNNNKREKIWEEIGKKLKKDYVDCKEKWVKLRKSYKRYKQTDDTKVISSSPNYKYFHLMSFLDVSEQQGNTNQQQRNVHQININVNQQQSNVNQQERKDNQQQRNETQQTSNGNQPKGIENKHHSGNNSGNQNLRPEASGQQYAQRAAQSVHVNVNVEGPKQPFCKNNPAARPKPKVARKQMPQGKRTNNTNNKKKKPCARPRPKLVSSCTLVADDLNSFCRQVRSTFGILPRELQIKAQDELFHVLSKFKKEALAYKRARADQQLMLLALPLRPFDGI